MTTRPAIWWASGVVSVGYLAVAGLMFGRAIPQVVAACGVPPLDGRFRWTPADATELVRVRGAEGLATYARMARLDLVYPALLATALVCWAVVLSAGLPRRVRFLLVGPAVLGMLGDYAENAAVWTILHADDVPDSPLIVAAGMAAAMKNIAGALAFAVVAALAVRRLHSRAQARRGAMSGRPAGARSDR